MVVTRNKTGSMPANKGQAAVQEELQRYSSNMLRELKQGSAAEPVRAGWTNASSVGPASLTMSGCLGTFASHILAQEAIDRQQERAAD